MRRVFGACAALLLFTPSALAQSQQQQRPTCEAPEHRALDFWVGEWDAFRADTDAPAGRSSIRREDDGCVITEHWVSAGQPYSGRSLNIYDRASGRWEQYWVDSTGNATHFFGAPIADGMRLATEGLIAIPGSPPQYMRMTLTRRDDGTVLQHGESSPDGREWTTRYAFVYRRRAE